VDSAIARARLAALLAGIFFSTPLAAHHPAPLQAGSGDRAVRLSFGDNRLLTHEGKPVRFFTDLVKDKVVLISFVFTACTDTCPLQTRNVAAAQSLLRGWSGTAVHFVSISVDPENDSPEVLREYASRFHAGPGWTFLTGNKKEIDAVTRGLAHAAPDREAHTTLYFLGNARSGRWQVASPDATPLELAERLRNLAAESS
jgi:protein SCO1